MPTVSGSSVDGFGVDGRSTNSYGVFGQSFNAVGVVGDVISQYAAVWGHNRFTGTGVLGSGDQRGAGVWGGSHRGNGVVGQTNAVTQEGGHISSAAVLGINTETGPGVYAKSARGLALVAEGDSVVFNGDFGVQNGRKNFKIDHPLDPKTRYLSHTCVESSEMKNVYDGVAQLDADGTASVDLPEWFEALNEDFRYQLTAVGQAAPNLHVAEEIYENRFKIGGGEEGMKVCWQVTGSRKDPWAAANPFEVEEEKPQEERGRYLEPSLYGAPEEQSVMRARMGEMREPPQLPQPPQIEPPGGPPMPPSFDVVRLQQQLEEQRRGRVEDEIDELRQQIKKLRRRRRKR
jgi:hypothetical protein